MLLTLLSHLGQNIGQISRGTTVPQTEYFPVLFVSSLPSVDKGKQACCRDFSALFVLFALAGVSPPAAQKPKITRKCIGGRCEAVLSEQKCAQARKGTQEILFVFSSVLTQYERISACQNLVFSCQSMVSIHRVCLRSSTSKTKKSSRFRSKIFGKQCLPKKRSPPDRFVYAFYAFRSLSARSASRFMSRRAASSRLS